MASSQDRPKAITTRCTCVIPAPPEEVYALLIDRARMFALLPNRVEIVSEEESPDGQGTVHARVHLPSGAVVDTHRHGVERVLNERVVTRGTTIPAAFARYSHLRFGRVEMEATCSLEAHGGGTAATMEVEWSFRPVAWHLFVGLFLRGTLQRKSEDQLQRIRGPFLKWPTHDRAVGEATQ